MAYVFKKFISTIDQKNIYPYFHYKIILKSKLSIRKQK